MKSETLSLKIIINKNGFSEESSYYSMKGLKKKKRFLVACKQIKYLILATLKNIMNHF